MGKKSKQSKEPLLYIVQNVTGTASTDMQSEYRMKLKPTQKQENKVQNTDTEETIEKYNELEANVAEDMIIVEKEFPEISEEIQDVSTGLLDEEKAVKPFRIVKEELYSATFYEWSTKEKIEYLSALPKYILKRLIVEIKLPSRLYIGKIISYQPEKNLITLLNTNNLKLHQIEVQEIASFKIISL